MGGVPVSRDPGRGAGPPGGPAGTSDRHPSLWSPEWRLVPQSPDWPEWMDDARAGDEDPGDLDLYEDPDCAPPAGLDDAELAALIAGAAEMTAAQARAAAAAARFGHTAAVGAVARGPPDRPTKPESTGITSAHKH